MHQALIPSSVRTVLLVGSGSDSAGMELMTQLIARRDDLNLLSTNSGREAMELAAAGQPDVVVMDTDVSDVNARDALAWLRRSPSTSHIPVIAVSSDALKTQIDAGLQAGFYRYLTKPFKLTDLLDAIYNSFDNTLERIDRLASRPDCRGNNV